MVPSKRRNKGFLGSRRRSDVGGKNYVFPSHGDKGEEYSGFGITRMRKKGSFNNLPPSKSHFWQQGSSRKKWSLEARIFCLRWPLTTAMERIHLILMGGKPRFDLIKKWILENPGASICTAQGVDKFNGIAIFQDYYDLKQFREAAAKFMGRVGGNQVTFDANRIVMSGGATAANETVILGRCLQESSNMEHKRQRSHHSQPSNPLGTILDPTMKSMVSFVNEINIHLVCDEIYAARVFSSPRFISIAEVIQDKDNCKRDLIRIVYSLSKDMGIPGFRVGIVFSFNDEVARCARRMSSFGLVSSQTQYLLASMLSEDEFVGNFLRESSMSNAGLFFWMDMGPLLNEQSLEGELELWRVLINEVKLNVSPGSSFRCSEPGWFRVCFANMDDETVEVALDRIRAFVLGRQNQEPDKSKHCQKKRLRLSFSSSILYDETIMSPHVISPHSSLVRASTTNT
ncbi:exocyst complex component SEC10-like [Hibiscus syriacus]|uniref:Exocyst complex component SEC10-like n=1 Tax=Hibiscus syriacus TaxID=106335 RepID=A0A6A3BZZ0_HIBSY|nr:exocyst complex component SEC10-like [Hibiscus syriacus]